MQKKAGIEVLLCMMSILLGSCLDQMGEEIDSPAIGLGSASLSWTPPVTNSDGSPLTDLSGYKLYYGTSQGSYGYEIQIDNPGITTFVVDNLSPNTYYFVAAALNSAGVASIYSNEAIKTVN